MDLLAKGVTAETLGSGIRFIRLHYSADPEKDQAWAERERATEADPRNWDVQMEMRRLVLDGVPVFSRYSDSIHCPTEYLTRPFELRPNSLYLGGWDAGQTLSPAFVLLETEIETLTTRALLEVVSTTGESMEEFAPRVIDATDAFYPQIRGDIRHYGDPTILVRSGPTKETAQQVARKNGIDIEPSTNDWTKRKSAVDHLLHAPGRFEICGFSCPVLRRGFQGQYRFQSSKSGDPNGAGAIILAPLKNAYSHVQDALQYPAIVIYDKLKPGGGGWSENTDFLNKLRNR